MRHAGIPTARYATVNTLHHARAKLRDFNLPVVLKADGLAAGKGVIIANSEAEAEQGITQLLTPGSTLVIEEFLTGEGERFIFLWSGVHLMTLERTQYHKA